MHGSVCPPPTGTAAAGRAARSSCSSVRGQACRCGEEAGVPTPHLGTRDSCSSSQDQSGQRPRMGSQASRQAPASKGSARIAYAPTAVPITEPPGHTHARPARPTALRALQAACQGAHHTAEASAPGRLCECHVPGCATQATQCGARIQQSCATPFTQGLAGNAALAAGRRVGGHVGSASSAGGAGLAGWAAQALFQARVRTRCPPPA